MSFSSKYYDAVVDAAGVFSTYTTIDSAIDDGHLTIWVKSGTYDGFTIDNQYTKIIFEPNCTVNTSDIVISADNATIIFGPNFTAAERLDINNLDVHLKMNNGYTSKRVDIAGTGDNCFIDGGGWDTHFNGQGEDSYGLQFGSGRVDGIIMNAKATGASTANNDAIKLRGPRLVCKNLKPIDAAGTSSDVIRTINTGTDCKIVGNYITNGNQDAIQINSNTSLTGRAIVVANYCLNAGDDGIDFTSNGDDSIAYGNIIQNQTGDSILVVGDNCVVFGNRCDGAINDSGTGTTGDATDNDVTAF